METKKGTNEYRGLNTFETELVELNKSAFVFGANASGKSNFIKAMSFMKAMVLESFDKESTIKKYKRFLFSTESESFPSTFEVVFLVNEGESKVQYRYGFEITSFKISKEWLYRKSKKEVEIFRRDSGTSEKIDIKVKEFEKAKAVIEFTRGDALFISTVHKFNIVQLEFVREWFLNIEIFSFNTNPVDTIKILQEDVNTLKSEILGYLKKADFGIHDFYVKSKEYNLETPQSIMDVLSKHSVSDEEGQLIESPEFGILDFDSEKTEKIRITNIITKHKIFNKDKNYIREISLPFEEYESEGTIKFFQLIGPFIKALSERKVIFVDELDSRLHCAIIRFLVGMFNSIDINKENAQLIASTHDVLLLEEKLRRDQVWFTQKNQYGESELYSLADFTGVRKNDLVLRKYLMGQFGAIPFIDKRRSER